MGFLDDTRKILKKIDLAEVAAVTEIVKSSRRVFTVGNGGGAAHASHFTSDLRKITGVESYCVNDNVAEISARINDDPKDEEYARWLRASRIDDMDSLFVFSVGGGSAEVSNNLRFASVEMKDRCGRVVAIVGKDGGYLRRTSTASIKIPSDSTPQVEGIQSVLAHMIACS